MDTMQIKLEINAEKSKGLKLDQIDGLQYFINNIRSPAGYTYCDFQKIGKNSNIILKISFPRYHAGVNAYLIKTLSQCKQVNKHFCDCISSQPLLEDAAIILLRLDIPFTFNMPQQYCFNSYSNIYQIFDYVYRRKNSHAIPKVYCRLEDMSKETITYANTPGLQGYNSKIVIYNQFKNIKAKTKNDQEFNRILFDNPDLKNRMRIEVSRRIRRRGLTRLEFREFDIASEYLPQYKQYILDNLFDLNILDEFYKKQTNILVYEFNQYKNQAINFSYETFILRNIHKIYDYEILRQALKRCIPNIKTRESAITVIRRVLYRYEKEHNIIIMDAYTELYKIRQSIERYKLRENKKYRTLMYK